jgi:tetratricopeptide (TPR) repeat protein
MTQEHGIQQLAEAHAALGLSLFLDLKWTDSQPELEQAIALNANSVTAHLFYGWYLAFEGRFPESLAQMNLAQALDPLSFAIAYTTGNILYWHREYDRSIEQYRKALDIQPGSASAVESLGDSYLAKNQCAEATENYARGEELDGNPDFAAALRSSYNSSGCSGMIQKQLELDSDHSSRDYAPFDAAGFAALLGKKNEAFRLLEKVYTERTGIVFLKIEPQLDNIRSDPCYADLLRRTGLAQ